MSTQTIPSDEVLGRTGDRTVVRSSAPTYSLRPQPDAPDAYRRTVATFTDQVLAAGEALAPIVDAFGRFVEETGREARRSQAEYLLEGLMLGVLWRARGHEAMNLSAARARLMSRIAAHRRAGGARLRDGSPALLLSLGAPYTPAGTTPSLNQVDRLISWLLASGEYDDEVQRLDGWEHFLDAHPAPGSVLRSLVGFAAVFESWSAHYLGQFSAGVDEFVERELPQRGIAEDTMQCSRRRVEYHLNMVGAEILNRAWRDEFLACRRHVVVMPGCMRRRGEGDCRAERRETDLRCSHCIAGCAVSAASRVAAASRAEAVAVMHGSDFSRFLRSPALQGGDVGIVGVACVPGLVGAGWRARATGLPAQCVLLDASGCAHWRRPATPTSINLRELRRILDRGRFVVLDGAAA